MIVVGIAFLFVVPSIGIAAGVAGLALAILWVAGVGRHTAERDPYSDRHRV